MFGRGASDVAVAETRVVTVLWPVPKLVIVGAGAIADALAQAAALLGWQTQTINDVATATGVIAGLAVLDKLVVISHDHEFAGPALAAALSSDVGYIGALGSRRTQQSRGRLAGLPGDHRPRPHPRAGRPRHRREHAGRDRGLDPRRGDGREVAEHPPRRCGSEQDPIH